MTTHVIKLSWVLLAVSILPCSAKERERQPIAVRDGSTIDKAIIIKAPLKKYVDEEWAYIKKQYPNASPFPGEQAILIHGGRYIDSMTFSTPRGQRTMYFDISGVKTTR
jgi:hypothetical protein